jgi:hypothetical protein
MRIKYKKESIETPFPQANDIYKILKFVQNLYNPLNLDRFSNIDLDFVSRQTLYYRAAAQYLGLLNKENPSELAKVIFDLDNNFLFISVVNLILRNKVFGMYYQTRDNSTVENYIGNLYHLNKTTSNRRMSTVKKWVEWCDIIINENNLNLEFEDEK